jgi:hypothetical protein
MSIDVTVARRIIRELQRRAARMPHAIELLMSPDDARAVLAFRKVAEAAGVRFQTGGIAIAGVRFRICQEMRDSREMPTARRHEAHVPIELLKAATGNAEAVHSEPKPSASDVDDRLAA